MPNLSEIPQKQYSFVLSNLPFCYGFQAFAELLFSLGVHFQAAFARLQFLAKVQLTLKHLKRLKSITKDLIGKLHLLKICFESRSVSTYGPARA